MLDPTAAAKKKTITNGKKPQEKQKYPCRFCHRVMASNGRVLKHENECNDNPHREIVRCEICDMELKPSTLRLHQNSKHGNMKSQPPSPYHSSQPSNSPKPMNSPNSMTVAEQSPKDNSIDPLLTMSPQVSPTDQYRNMNPPMSFNIIKVEKIEPIIYESSTQLEVKTEKIQ